MLVYKLDDDNKSVQITSLLWENCSLSHKILKDNLLFENLLSYIVPRNLVLRVFEMLIDLYIKFK